MTNPNAFALYKLANPDRVRLIAAAIATLTKDGIEVTIEALQAILPDDMALDMVLDHVASIAAAESGIVTAKMDTKESGDGATATMAVIMPPPMAAGEATVDDHDGAALDASAAEVEVEVEAEVENLDTLRERVIALGQKAAALRSELYVMRNQAVVARGALADSITAFVHGVGRKVSVQDNIRAELKASLETRAAQSRGDGLPPVPQAGPSTLDRSALYSGSASGLHTAEDHVRGRFVNGGFRRGSFPASAKNAATRLKLPSAQ
jgi:hypothetical protein